MAASVAVVVVLPSRAPIVRHHASMLARHPLWNRSQYMSVFHLSVCNFHLFACLCVNGRRVVNVSCSLWSRLCSVVLLYSN